VHIDQGEGVHPQKGEDLEVHCEEGDHQQKEEGHLSMPNKSIRLVLPASSKKWTGKG
jgi:hypothetical protein